MKFPGFMVSNQADGSVLISHMVFDETELSPDSNWMEGYSNKDLESCIWLGRDIDSALLEVRKRMVR